MSSNSLNLSKKTRKQLSRAIGALLVIFFGWFAGQYPEIFTPEAEVPAGMYRVVSIEDGDTLTVDMNGVEERIRFIGVDTPETKDPRKVVQCFGHAATKFTKELVGTSHVSLVADKLSTNRDRYDRLLRYIYLPDGRLVQAEIIKEGYGFAYTSFPFEKSEEFIKYQRTARIQNKGLWSACEPEQNSYGGYTSNPE
jgi:micrococcal nuclease